MGKSGGIDPSVQQGSLAVAQQGMGIAQQQNARAAQEFQASFPGFQQSENYYQQLASGDPAAIARAIAPASQQINQQAQGAAERIVQDVPRGGAQNLALAENQINKGAQIGQAATQGYLSSFQNLAGLAGQGIGQSTQAAGTAISGLSAAGNQYSNVAQQQAEGKASQLGFISSLAGSGAEVAAMCWIAEAYWGVDDWRTWMVRRWLTRVYAQTFIGSMVVALYRRYGERAAGMFKAHRLVRAVLSPLFDWFLSQAVQHGG